MQKLGYGPDKKLALTVSTRNVATFRDPAVILIDQLKEIYVDGTLETIETANWHVKVTRKDYNVALNATGSGVDDPDQQFYENYACGSARNYSGYCNPELDTKFDEQSAMSDQEKRSTWCGRSTSNCRKTPPARSSSTSWRQPALSRRSRA
jgi:peptide/nickel transport system substrate-binding protein